jgi:replicative superfamily II helicase
MIDFSKYLGQQGSEKKKNPLEIYESLDRASDKGPLRLVQSEVLTDWHINYGQAKDVIIKLHTGQGKTLIGLLILQSRLNETNQPVLYLCPNKLLAEQTCEQAKQFGIKYCQVDKNNHLPQEFLDGESVLITHVQMLFNGLTKFKLRQRALLVNSIVLDDSHACIDSIQDAFTIKIERGENLYNELLSLFENDLSEQGLSKTEEIKQGEFDSFLPVPYWAWSDKISEVIALIVKNKEKEFIVFAWQLIGDMIQDCQCIISGTSIEIAPYLNPVDLFGTFSRCPHRVFMSATTNNDAFFIKSLGVEMEVVKHPLKYVGEKWSGEKLILIPYLIHEDLNRVLIVNRFAQDDPKRKFGVVVLTPSKEASRLWKERGARVADKWSIGEVISDLRSGNFSQTVVLANRYDGIDLPDDACRILILDSKPFASLLSERLQEHYRENSRVIDIKIAQKIEQGLGRAVRGEKDYCTIIITGSDLINVMRTKGFKKYFSGQTNKQIEIGMDVGKLAIEQRSSDDDEIVLANLIGLSTKRDDNWKKYYSKQMDSVAEPSPDNDLLDLLHLERKAEELHISGEHSKAIETIQKLLDTHVEPNDKIERAYYLQEMGRYAYRNQKSISNAYQVNAYKTNKLLLKPTHGIEFQKLKMDKRRGENIVNWLKSFESYEDLQIQVSQLYNDLSFGIKSDKFEHALCILGLSLGFASERPDKELKRGPDNLWNVQGDSYVLFECKNQVDEDRSEISKSEAEQMMSSYAWFKLNYVSSSVKSILIIPTKNVVQATSFLDPVDILRKKGLNALKLNWKRFFEEFREYKLDTITETQIDTYLRLHQLTVEDILNGYTEKPVQKRGK